MKKIKIMIVIVLIIIVVLICAIFIRQNKIKNSSYELEDKTDSMVDKDDGNIIGGPSGVTEEKKQAFQKCNLPNVYFSSKEILTRYIEYFKKINGDEEIDVNRIDNVEEYKRLIRDDAINGIIQIFDEEYKNKQSYDRPKIVNIASKYRGGDYNLYINEIYDAYITQGSRAVLIYAEINKVPFNCMLKIDFWNEQYSMFWEDYMLSTNYNKARTEEVTIDTDIKENSYNKFFAVYANKEYISGAYLDDMKNKMNYYPEKLYEQLDEKYKQKRFPEYSDFLKFLNANKQRIKKININKYKYAADKIMILDDYDNIYTFNISNVMDYTIILDNYTIPDEDFISQYMNATAESKVSANVRKIFMMINQKDYTAIYNLLNKTFKDNNYQTEESLEEFINSNFYDYNTIGIENIEPRSGYYVCTLNYKNGENNNSESKKMTIIMKLLEGTDFEFSFSV